MTRRLVGFAQGLPVYEDVGAARKSSTPDTRKAATGTTTTSPTGDVVAIVSTLDVVDLDLDVVQKGALPPGRSPVVISVWNHGGMGSQQPAGVGTVGEEGNHIVLRGRLLLDTDAGRATWSLLKALGGAGEWSIGFLIRQSSPGTVNGQRVRLIQRLDIMEVSPVVRGAAGPGRTGLLELHGAKDPRMLAVERVAAENAEYIRRRQGHGRMTKSEKDLARALDRARELGVSV